MPTLQAAVDACRHALVKRDAIALDEALSSRPIAELRWGSPLLREEATHLLTQALLTEPFDEPCAQAMASAGLVEYSTVLSPGTPAAAVRWACKDKASIYRTEQALGSQTDAH
jgi:hypothetical protein